CEQHIDTVLTSIGGKNIETNFQRGESVFELPDGINAEKVKQAIKQAKYQAVEIDEISTQKPKDIELDNKKSYDLLVMGSGGAGFCAAIKSIEYDAKVGMIERGTVGGTCVASGCVPSKALLRAGEIKHVGKSNPAVGIGTCALEVDLGSLRNQKNELV